MTLPWPAPTDPIVALDYELVVGFNELGEPVYRRGAERSPAVLDAVQRLLEPVKPTPAEITSVTMGSVELVLKSGARVVLHPVFHPSARRYRDLFKMEAYDAAMPAAVADLLNKWREALVQDAVG